MRLRAGQKLFLSYLVLLGIVVLLLMAGLDQLLRRQLIDLATDELRRDLILVRSIVDRDPIADPHENAVALGDLVGLRVTVIAPDGEVVGESEATRARLPLLENHAGRPEVREAMAGRSGVDIRLSRTEDEEFLYVAVLSEGGDVIRVARPLGEVRAIIRTAQRNVLLAGAGAVLLAALFSLLFSQSITRPIRRMAATARAMAAGDLDLRARAPRMREFTELGDALNFLAAELQVRLRELEDEQAEMNVLIDSMAEVVLAFAPDGRLRRANAAARAVFSLPESVQGTPPEEVSRRSGFLDLVRHVIGGAAVPATELRQGDLHLLATGAPLPGGGAVVVMLDVTRLRRLEAVRREFVANASHELKTPLTTIRGYSETLLDDTVPPDLREQFTRTIHRNAERLQRILEDLLDLSRIESGGWAARAEPDDLRVATREVMEDFADRAGEARVTLEAQIDPAAARVHVDPSALRQVLTNLVSNAIRHTGPDGRVTVLSAPDPEGAGVLVEVRDTGTGIPSAHLPRIFERFYRVDAARSRAAGGTGLGLAIVRHLVEAHGGRVWAESELGKGTSIFFTIPVAQELPRPDAAS